MSAHLTYVSAYPAAPHGPDWLAMFIIGVGLIIVIPVTCHAGAWCARVTAQVLIAVRAQRVAKARSARFDPLAGYAFMAVQGPEDERTGGRR